MRTSSNKKSSQRNDRKVLMAEESTKSWADSDSESSSSSSSSSDSEQEEAHCLMADNASDDEVFDFANTEFTREDLVQALNDMVHEYKTLSHTFEEIKAENASLKNSSAESSSDELEDTDSLKTELTLVDLFTNGTVRDGLVVSTVNGVAVEISEKLFAKTFDLPVDGLADIFEMPKDKIFDARSIISLTGEAVTLSGLKSQMKMHYRLLCDIMAKSISVKAGSFNAITVEKFSLLTAMCCKPAAASAWIGVEILGVIVAVGCGIGCV
ncbi:hypothetical protein F511_26616 [Dorcoceras hygrometricum]|uniref:Uncharacterized protein n=1 Tax=Dorcoceras hygrometricum TaxID=472368 RepID=A0A2Z7C288_9LAMI|nr:hypothetical protein F511_26616 [Dorcoceras hygrometricum]